MTYMRWRPPTGWTPPDWNCQYMGLQQLLIWIHEHRSNPERSFKAIEIGSWRGESTHIFASSGLFRGGITCIDSWEYTEELGKYTVSQESMDHYKNDFEINCRMFLEDNDFCNVDVIRGRSENCHDYFEDNSVDFIYIDGDHSAESVEKDIKNYMPKLKKGGILAGHDYHEKWWPGVVETVNRLLGEPDQIFEDSSWVKVVK